MTDEEVVVSGSLDAIKRVVAAFERSDWAEIDVRVGDVRVHLAANATADSPASRSEPMSPTVPTDPSVDPNTEPKVVASTRSVVPEPPVGAHVVSAPTPGIFWRSPEPGAPPFVEVGGTVEASSTVCIIEVMKLMNHLKAAVDGRVVEVYGENGVAVSKDQALFAIMPSDP